MVMNNFNMADLRERNDQETSSTSALHAHSYELLVHSAHIGLPRSLVDLDGRIAFVRLGGFSKDVPVLGRSHNVSHDADLT